MACELRYGATKRGSRKLTRQIEAILRGLTIKPLESNVERAYAAIRVALKRKGMLKELAEVNSNGAGVG